MNELKGAGITIGVDPDEPELVLIKIRVPRTIDPSWPDFIKHLVEMHTGIVEPILARGLDLHCDEDLDDTSVVLVSGTPMRPKSPADIRAANRATIDAALKDPDQRVLSGRGKREGKVWDLWCQNLSQVLENCNNKPSPLIFSSAAMDVCFREAVAGKRIPEVDE